MPPLKNFFVFDLDGTLVDTLPDIAFHCNRILERAGYSRWPAEDYRERLGWGLKETLQLSLPPETDGAELAGLMDAFKSSYTAEPVIQSALYPGIEPLLTTLHKRGCRLMVYTNKVEETARRILDILLPRHHFEAVLGAREGRPHKPDPSAFLQYADSTQLEKSAILYVGDSPVDVETARRAEVDFAGVSWGYRSAAELRKAGCQTIISKTEELLLFQKPKIF